MKILVEAVISFLFERVPVLNFLNGHKRLIGNVLIVAGAILEGLRQAFPHYAILSEVVAYYALIVGALTRVLGDMHAQIKAERYLK